MEKYKNEIKIKKKNNTFRNISTEIQVFEISKMEFFKCNIVQKLDDRKENFSKELETIQNNQIEILKLKKEDNKFDKRCTRSAHVKLKTLLRDINKQRNTLCSWTRRHSVVNMSVLPKVIYKFNARVWGLLFFFFGRT